MRSPRRSALSGGRKAVRTLIRGTPRCPRPFERPGPVTRRARRLRGAPRPPGRRARREDRRCARAAQCATPNTALHGFDMVRARAVQRPAARGGAGFFPSSTAVHARRIIFDIAPVFARGTFLQCLHGARFNLADGYVAT
ncbi:hypothetical protein DIE16_12270 [Burkholderia sp. Bp9090]|nr:hypothetical protein DIE16_12270 [Burkholderia sp. Bp9090]